ncbi:hypothetical protein MZM54_03330 [[Brevibacterium] frigoritolerans]|nr:hypothetical protein [Peribacillus frigoritolerans]
MKLNKLTYTLGIATAISILVSGCSPDDTAKETEKQSEEQTQKEKQAESIKATANPNGLTIEQARNLLYRAFNDDILKINKKSSELVQLQIVKQDKEKLIGKLYKEDGKSLKELLFTITNDGKVATIVNAKDGSKVKSYSFNKMDLKYGKDMWKTTQNGTDYFAVVHFNNEMNGTLTFFQRKNNKPGEGFNAVPFKNGSFKINKQNTTSQKNEGYGTIKFEEKTITLSYDLGVDKQELKLSPILFQ